MGLNSNFRIGDNGEIIRLSDKPDDNQKNDGNNENGKKRKTGRFKTILIAALGLGLLGALVFSFWPQSNDYYSVESNDSESTEIVSLSSDSCSSEYDNRVLQTMYTFTEDATNFREEPNLNSDIICEIPKYTPVQIHQFISDRWVYASVNGQRGYVSIRVLLPEGDADILRSSEWEDDSDRRLGYNGVRRCVLDAIKSFHGEETVTVSKPAFSDDREYVGFCINDCYYIYWHNPNNPLDIKFQQLCTVQGYPVRISDDGQMVEY